MEPNMEPNQSNASSKIVAALIIGLIVGFITGAFWQDRRLSPTVEDDSMALEEGSGDDASLTDDVSSAVIKGTTGDTSSAAIIEAVPGVTSPAILAEISAENQVSGDTVEVSILNISEPIWIAVRDDVDGSLGNILGAHKAFTAGDATVNLLRPTVVGTTYHVVMYKDVGDASFNHKEDVLLEKGQVVFKAE
ncbi:MAG: hypothetical protein COV91_03165 [Candidatus Taylorbacteria bacterium CG11_big_fil_rev_8_21_14_0_20_46_11]|uniref:Uncharacterized protein n=1 Tax=Candidatus Taylorbacteria bacterium CG11_big_fil_rev_8_21_14_0_20_46_11 TaxID=1975025 RepID=A0A2H0KDY3_9BACT|nr:MAG: hypothetical protein COV91_03165 [Candidatus Taylorbacteria bacterium CG11_big_fil_rev_8_21_14_0_20_46_11]